MKRIAALLLLAALGPLAARSGACDPPVEVNVYFGNLHSHTSYSDGSGTPEDAYRHARFEAHLDFLAITEHNHDKAEQGAAADRRDGILIATNHDLYNG